MSLNSDIIQMSYNYLSYERISNKTFPTENNLYQI